MKRSSGVLAAVTAFVTVLSLSMPGSAASLTTQLVSVSSSRGLQGNADSFTFIKPINPDGRFVAFASTASNLVPGDTNGGADVFVRDRRSPGRTTRISVSSTGKQANDESFNPSISKDGNLVAFESLASNLVPGDTNGAADVFVRNVSLGKTTRVSVTPSGKQARGDSFGGVISDDGRLVSFMSTSRLVSSDDDNHLDVYVRDLVAGTLRLVSVSSAGQKGNDDTFATGFSADDRLMTLESFASNLVPGDTNSVRDVFTHDLANGRTTRVSVSSSGAQENEESFAPSISANGRFVAFTSAATNLVPGDKNGFVDLFVRDLRTGITQLASVSSTGVQGNGDSSNSKGISADGRFIAYRSFASNLVPGDTNGAADVFLLDRSTGKTIRASVSSTGAQATVAPGAANPLDQGNAALSADGRWVVFLSTATNLVPGGTNNMGQIFVRGPFG